MTLSRGNAIYNFIYFVALEIGYNYKNSKESF